MFEKLIKLFLLIIFGFYAFIFLCALIAFIWFIILGNGN